MLKTLECAANWTTIFSFLVKILLLKFVAKEIKKFVHLEELFTDLLKVVYKVARLPIQVPNIDKRTQHFFEKI